MEQEIAPLQIHYPNGPQTEYRLEAQDARTYIQSHTGTVPAKSEIPPSVSFDSSVQMEELFYIQGAVS